MIEYVDAGKGYQPGACNIGPAEIRRRQQAGILGLIGTVALAAALLLIDAPTWSRLLVALPAFLAFSGFIQARTRFCAGYGLSGLRNFGALGEEVKVEDGAQRAADRRKAVVIFGGSALLALAVGVIFAALPI